MNGQIKSLIVDDEELIRLNLRALLEDLDYLVVEAANGKDGLDVFDREQPDLVLVDLRMPVMDGRAMIAALQEKSPDTPVIVISGTGTVRDAVDSLRLGAWDYIIKPVADAEGIGIIIKRALEKSHLIMENRRYREHLEEIVQIRTNELFESEARYRRLLESITSYVYTVTIKDGVPVSTVHGPGCEAVTGFTPDEYNSDPHLWYRTIHQDDRPLVLEMSRRILDQNQSVSFEHRICHKNAAVRWVHNTLVPHRNNKRELLSYDGIIVDITDRLSLEAQIRQAQKMESVGRLAGGVAHDFNNMLGVIIGYSELSMDHVDSSSYLFSNLQEIRKAATRSADLTRQLLAFARKQTIAPRVLDLNETVEGMLKMLRRLIGEDINLTWLPGAGVWPIKIDPSQIDQILANLCVNARDAISEVGMVTIETQSVHIDETYPALHSDIAPGDYVLLSVSDNGCGMDKGVLYKLFEPFFTTKESGKGTGLGLATVYGIVKQNNGFINVSSEPGLGATFNIYLPRHRIEAEEAPSEKQASQMPLGHETILLVEDEQTILEMGKLMLEKMGYQVLTAGKPTEAMNLAREHARKIQLLITDVVMPEMNGRDLAENLFSFCPGLKTLFISGYTSNVIAHHGILEDGVNFIQKPFSIEELAVKVREALDSK